MKYLNIKSFIASALVIGMTSTVSVAADITMNLGFGAPEESLYGRFGKIFEAKAEEYKLPYYSQKNFLKALIEHNKMLYHLGRNKEFSF